MLRILVVDDEVQNREALVEMLRRLGHETAVACDGRQALDLAAERAFDLILSDVRMPVMDGLTLFDSIRTMCDPKLATAPFVFMTAYGRLEEAVEAMRKGALNFLSKPLRKKDLVSVVEEAEKVLAVRGRVEIAAPSQSRSPLIFGSRIFSDTVQLVDKVAASMASVLLTGESGSGKEMLARRLHEQSGRGNGPFIAFHAGAVPETLLESELFGHERGAFTGAESARTGLIPMAQRGTFFIDELSTMPPAVQAKLLRVVQDRQVTPLGSSEPIDCDVRWVAATNEDLESLVSQGKFRADLLYRLNVVEVRIPSLRERRGDILALAENFLEEFCRRDGRSLLRLSTETIKLLEDYAWPGNVRELRNVIERAVALAMPEDTEVAAELLPGHMKSESTAREIRIAIGASLQSVEDKLIAETLRSCDGDKARAAALLGVAPRTLYRWMERTGLKT